MFGIHKYILGNFCKKCISPTSDHDNACIKRCRISVVLSSEYLTVQDIGSEVKFTNLSKLLVLVNLI